MHKIEPAYTKRAVSSTGEIFTLEYHLTNCVCTSDGAEGIPSYGICVEKNAEGKDTESETVMDITTSKEAAMQILKVLCENSVTPATVRDVIEDIVAMQV